MDSYYISKEDFDALTQDIFLGKKKELPTAVKTAFTRM